MHGRPAAPTIRDATSAKAKFKRTRPDAVERTRALGLLAPSSRTR